MQEQRGCQYVGCEDVAAEPVTILGDPNRPDVLLCPGHAPYVRQAFMAESGLGVGVAAGENDRERTRVWVWKGSGGPG